MTVTYYFGPEDHEEEYEVDLDWHQCHEAIAHIELDYYNNDRKKEGLPKLDEETGIPLIEHFLNVIDDTDNIIEIFSEEIKDYYEDEMAKQWSCHKAETEEINKHPYYWM